MSKNRKKPAFKLNHRYYFLDKEDYVIIREDRFTYYIVDSMSIDRCDDKDERGLMPMFEIDKFINGKKHIEQTIAEFMYSIGIEL